jgi:Uri superfamily endonuclease
MQLSFFIHAGETPALPVGQPMETPGAYVLCIDVKEPLRLPVGALGVVSFPAGRYAYVGSARRGIESRVARHRRLAEQKTGKLHWHIDYLLVNPNAHLASETVLEDGAECEISRQIARLKGVIAPIRGFGSSDCKSGCEAHLYLMAEAYRDQEISRILKGSKARRTRRRL